MSREQSRRALEKLDEVDRKRAEQRRLERELRNRLEEDAYDQRHTRIQSSRLVYCGGACGRPLQIGEMVLEFLNDDGSVVSRRHYPSCPR